MAIGKEPAHPRVFKEVGPQTLWASSHYGHFPIIEQIGKQAYKLRLGNSVSLIHSLFYVSLLAPCLTTM